MSNIVQKTWVRCHSLSHDFAVSHAQRSAKAVLTIMGAELSTLRQRRAKTRAFKQGMMQELLTGKIRLP